MSDLICTVQTLKSEGFKREDQTTQRRVTIINFLKNNYIINSV